MVLLYVKMGSRLGAIPVELPHDVLERQAGVLYVRASIIRGFFFCVEDNNNNDNN